MSFDYRDNICFILVRPVFLGNIGSAARVMKNFGYSKLRLVAPPKNYKDAEARKMAVGAFDILKQAEVFDELPEALADVSMAAGTTSGRQRTDRLKDFLEATGSLISAAQSHMVAIVFGDERDGLRADELRRCHLQVTIPTEAALPSLNLAQSAAIVAYELNRAISLSPPEPTPDVLPTGADDDEIMRQLELLIDQAGFSRTYNRSLVISELRSAYQRMQPTLREADLLKGCLMRVNQKLKPESDAPES